MLASSCTGLGRAGLLPRKPVTSKVTQRGHGMRVMAKKGFGGEEQTATVGVKVNKRGKVTSQPGRQKKQSEIRKEAEARKEAEEEAAMLAAEEAAEIEEAAAMEVPQVVTDRMLKRIVIFSGLPVFTGFMLYPVFYFIKTGLDVDLPIWVVYITQLLVFGGGLLGITYGVTSASWDPKREGSFLGWTEFRANLPIVLENFGKK